MKRSALRSTFWILPIVVALAVLPVLADAAHTAKQTPPVKMGTSGGSSADKSTLYCCGGTLGAAVLYDGRLSILSNNHVLARSGLAKAGETTIQPALIDNNCSSTGLNSVGAFAGNLVPLGRNVDAAISFANTGMVDSTGAIIDIGVPCNTVQAPTVGLSVKKSGRTTGTTTGTVQAINSTVTVQYQKGCGTGKKFTQTYTNQITITGTGGSFSAGGDSGSLIVSNDGTPNPVGLLFAGNTTTTIGNRISDVVAQFQSGGHTFSFVGNTCAAAAFKERPLNPPDAELEYVTKIKEANEAALFAHPGVIGVGVGQADDDAFRAVMVIYVDSGRHMRPHGLPTEIDGIPVKVVPTEPFVAY